MVWDEALAAYNFGPTHPLAPVRVELTIALARHLGVLDAPTVSLEEVDPAPDDLLQLVHEPDYVQAVRRVDDTQGGDLLRGLGTPDNPVFSGMHDASALVAGASVGAARAVWNGETEHGVNVAGGLHHAMPGLASGFCIYNDPAIAIAWLLQQGATRIGYVDVDVHHGDGVQKAFYDDPRVLTISLHESPLSLFPGTGHPDELGGPNGRGYAVNVALPAGTGDAGWLRSFEAVVPPLLEGFQPQVLLTQHGCDSHALDPLAHLMLTVDGQRTAYARLHQLAHETAGGSWIAVGGGGYELARVVPRAWTHLLAEAAGSPISPETPTPEEWRSYATRRTRDEAPTGMTDGYDPAAAEAAGYDPDDPVDRAVGATRQAAFPLHGLDPKMDSDGTTA